MDNIIQINREKIFAEISERQELLRQYFTKNSERNQKMFEEYKQGSTLEQVAKNYTITRQRVQQILSKFPDYKKAKRHTKIVYVTSVCPQCHKEFKHVDYSPRHYCSRACQRIASRNNPTMNRREWLHTEEGKKLQRERMKIYYHEVLKNKPNWKEIVAKRNYEQSLKRISNV